MEGRRQRGPVTGRKARSGLEAGKQGSSATGWEAGKLSHRLGSLAFELEARRPAGQAGRPGGPVRGAEARPRGAHGAGHGPTPRDTRGHQQSCLQSSPGKGHARPHGMLEDSRHEKYSSSVASKSTDTVTHSPWRRQTPGSYWQPCQYPHSLLHPT